MVTQNPGGSIGNIAELFINFAPPKPGEATDSTGVFKATLPSGLEALNQAKILPEVVGQQSPNPALQSINSIFDDALRDYIESLPFDNKESFLRAFSGAKISYPEFNTHSGHGGHGVIKSITGRGFGIIADGLKLLDLPSAKLEQGIGFYTSYLLEGFGNNLTAGERFEAGKLFYEQVGYNLFGSSRVVVPLINLDLGVAGKDGFYEALEIASNDQSHHRLNEFVRENRGGVVDLGMRVVLDPLWAVGGVPIVPGLIKMTKIKQLDPLADIIRTGLPIQKAPGISQLINAANRGEGLGGKVGRAALFPLRALGVPIESRMAVKTAGEFRLAEDLAKKFTDEEELVRALGRVSRSGFARNLINQQPERAADSVANAIMGKLSASLRNLETPQQMRQVLDDLQNGRLVIPGANEQRILEQIAVLRKIDFDKFTSLSKGADDWKQKFIGELMNGGGKKVDLDVSGSLVVASREFFQVGPPGALQRMFSGMKWQLGFWLLNSPRYVFLNIINNTFTTTFDAIDAFDRTGWDAAGVLASRVGIFRGKHDEWMRINVGDNWKEVRDRIGLGGEWQAKEFGWSKEGNQHLWDNTAFNFGVKVANFFDVSARRTAAEFGLLRSRHYLGGMGKVFPKVPDELADIIPGNIDGLDLIARRDDIASGEAFGWVSMRRVENELYAGIDDVNEVLARRETLDVHLAGQKMAVENAIIDHIKNGYIEDARNVLNKAKAEMRMYQQRANRLSDMGPSSPGAPIESIHDLRVNDWANLNDEFTHWATQQEMLLEASGAFTPLRRGAEMKRLTDAFNEYVQIRQETLGLFADSIHSGVRAKDQVDTLELVTKTYRETAKAQIDRVVNQLAKTDINQARIFNNASKRYLDSLGEIEDAYRSALRSVYHPRSMPETEALEAIRSAAAKRSEDIRSLFAENIEEFRVGSFPPPPMMNDFPTMAGKFDTYNEVWGKYTDHMSKNLDRLVADADWLRTSADADNLLKFVDEQVAPLKADYEFAQERFAAHMANFSMLDYQQQTGLERYIQTVFPYEFWPTRTAWHWSQRALAKPGAVNSLYNLYEFQQDWQDAVNERYVNELRERLADENISPEVRAELESQLANRELLAGRMRKLIIPVPFLNDLINKMGLPGTFANEIAFDPYAFMFPVVEWAKDYGDFSKEPGNAFGKLYRYLEQNTPVAPNPMIKSILGLSGVLPEGEEAFEWMGKIGSPAATVAGMGPAGQAIHRWASLGDEGPIAKLEEKTGVDIRDFYFEHGYGPQGVLNYLASEITGADPRDEKNFELYGTSRVLGALAAEDSRLLTLEQERKRRIANGEKPEDVHADINFRRDAVAQEYVKAYYEQDGPIWDKARKTYATQQGLKDLTSWLFGMGGINIWQPGEAIQNGLDFLFTATMKVGDKEQRDAFFDRYPEFTPKRIQDTVLSNQEAAMDIARESLWFWELELTNMKYDSRLTDLNNAKTQLYNEIAEIEKGGLNLRTNREARSRKFDEIEQINKQLSPLYDQKQADLDKIDALYGRPSNSTSKNPWERGLDNRADQWYLINRIKDEDERNKAKDEFLDSYSPAGVTNQGLDWLFLGARAQAIREKAALDGFGKSNEERRKINEARDRAIEELTLEAETQITRKDIVEHLGLKQQGPITTELAEYKMAQTLFQRYRAIELLGLGDDEERRRKKEFWDSNPLLERYYGLESYHGHPDFAIQQSLQTWYALWDNAPEDGEARQSYLRAHDREIKQLRAILEPAGLINNNPNARRLAEIWDGYYQLSNAEAKRAYLNNNRAEINDLNKVLNRQPSKSQADVVREGNIWSHYYSLPQGRARTSYLIVVQDELNEIRRRLGKDPLENIGFVKENPRLSDSAPVTESDIKSMLGIK